MLIKEYFAILREVWYKCKGPINFDWIIIKEKNQDYIKSFNFFKYLKNNVFNNNLFFNLLYVFTLFFILKILYDFFTFLWYTFDLIISCFFKWFFYIIYISLDKWETYIFKNMYIFRKDPVKSKLYKREKGILAKNRAKFFKQFINPLIDDFNAALKIDKRNYSVIIKYYKYFSIWIPSLFNALNSSLRLRIFRLKFKIESIKIKILKIDLWIIWSFFKFCYWVIAKYCIKLYIWIKSKFSWYYIKEWFFHYFAKFFIIYDAYKIRKALRRNFYTFLYINYFFFYKKRYTYKSKSIFVHTDEDTFINNTHQALSLTFNFYSFNFKFVYLWHCYIKKIPYLTYLETVYNKKDSVSYITETNYKHNNIILTFCIFWFFSYLIRFLRYIRPRFDYYYVKYVAIIKKHFNILLYHLLSFIAYIITFPFIFIYYCYRSIINIKNSFKYLIIFLKNLFNK